MQTTTIPLPEHPDQPGEEQWAEIRAVSTLRSGDRKAVESAIKFAVTEDGAVDRSFSAGDTMTRREALLKRVIVDWTLPEPLPSRVDAPDEIDVPIAIYDALIDATREHFDAVDFTRPRTRTSGQDDSGGSATTSKDTASEGSSPTPN